MKTCDRSVVVLVVLAMFVWPEGVRPAERKNSVRKPVLDGNKIFGEWRIRVRPDKGSAYKELIEQKGLRLFRKGGGRMVGWWNTLVGNLYEHVTIWEYDDMAAYQHAVELLGKDEQFARFAAARDPLLTGEQSRFLTLAAFAEPPALAESAPYIIHEVHRVPLQRRDAYLKFMEKTGLPLLKQYGFRPVGPWLVAVGTWTEITYLFRFQSLAESDRLIAAFSASPHAVDYRKTLEYVDEMSTRLLVPTPFAAARPAAPARNSSLLPHLEELAPGIFAAGFAERWRSANSGWVALGDETLLIDLPRGVPADDYVREVQRQTGKPVRRLVLTNVQSADIPTIEALFKLGVTQVLTSSDIRKQLLTAGKRVKAADVAAVTAKTAIGDGNMAVEFLSFDGILGAGSAAVYVPGQHVLFAGPLVVHGPRAPLRSTDTAAWLAALHELQAFKAEKVVPGRGSWGASAVLDQQERFLAELRRQVGYAIACGRPRSALSEIHLCGDCLACTPYDNPSADDIEHVYQELTVPFAPFNNRLPDKKDSRPHALVLIGDEPHEPGHIEEGLRPVFEATGVVPHFTVDVAALSSENLARVQLLVILRDGLQRPRDGKRANYVWMTPEQERAVVRFVEGGGAFLNLHNAMGLYPDGGPYLKLAGGRYTGHGPLERFRVEVVDTGHPITRGMTGFSVLDEQHTPEADLNKVHQLLRSRSDEGKVAVAGWAYEPGRGRLCHLAPGHTRESLLHPTYQRLLRNAVLWCLRRQS